MPYTKEEISYLRRKKINPESFRGVYKMLKKLFGDDTRITSARRSDEK